MRSASIPLLAAIILFSCHCGERSYHYDSVTIQGGRLPGLVDWNYDYDVPIIDFDEFVLVVDTDTPGFKEGNHCSYDNVTEDDVSQIDVIAVNDYNDQIKATESINPIMTWRFRYSDGDDFKELPINIYPEGDIFLRPIEPPSVEGNYKFALIVTLNSGKVLSDTTEQYIRVPQ